MASSLSTMTESRPLTVVHINGSINSGKSTVGRVLAQTLADARFIDGDDHAAPEHLPLPVQWAFALTRIEEHIAAASFRYLVVAYPLEQADFERIDAACRKRRARLVVVTLSPPLEVVLSDRGARVLTHEERERIVEMYAQGYQSRSFSDIVLDNAGMSAEETVACIAAYLADGHH
jgi:cytidylate kinase